MPNCLSMLVSATTCLNASKEPDAEDILTEVLLEEETGNRTDAEALNGTVQRSGSCSPGWSRLKGRCYHVFPIPTTWFGAQRNCRSMQAHLASIHDFEVNYQLLRLITAAGQRRSEVWIGGSDLRRERHWYWVDGTRFGYTNWCQGEPNNFFFKQHCLQMNYSRSRCWDDGDCNYLKPFICARFS
ncbi:hypothetical protein ATANTOWER_004022 [Ataeniobius toweri]|uniref:C-type lectin domain-containing protein n=1 Tax=Ataeniobius toweri TaxID=208326 RepID=A0ABU7ANB0_9TELE|nr:hypothetical protein [Ataeniobius toweri]